jgi:hypothetical protein
MRHGSKHWFQQASLVSNMERSKEISKIDAYVRTVIHNHLLEGITLMLSSNSNFEIV